MIGEIFGHNQLRSYCLHVQPVTCWHPPVFLHQIGAYSINSSKMIGNFLQSWTSTGYFSNSTGSSVTKHRFSPIIGYRLFYPIRCTYYNVYLIFISLNNLCANYWEGATMLESIRRAKLSRNYLHNRKILCKCSILQPNPTRPNYSHALHNRTPFVKHMRLCTELSLLNRRPVSNLSEVDITSTKRLTTNDC